MHRIKNPSSVVTYFREYLGIPPGAKHHNMDSEENLIASCDSDEEAFKRKIDKYKIEKCDKDKRRHVNAPTETIVPEGESAGGGAFQLSQQGSSAF